MDRVEPDERIEQLVRYRVRRALSKHRWELVKWVALPAAGYYLRIFYEWMATR